MKHCTRCKIEKSLGDFFKTKRSKDGHQPACKACMNVAYHQTRAKKPDHYNRVASTRRRELTERIREWKEQRGCLFCPERFGPCLQLHHTNPLEKDLDPSNAAQYSWEVFLVEAAKCVVVCSNCHTKVHHGVLTVGEQSSIINPSS